ncbi:MAG: glycoside hydrolase family 52 protein [Kiritimatiellota bacterium]|nr:glycoside hydrolase family 52 protein [Kiritimatiellota bacterium]
MHMPLDESMPEITADKALELVVLHAPMGSRHSFSLFYQHKGSSRSARGVNVGALGLEHDATADLVAGIKLAGDDIFRRLRPASEIDLKKEAWLDDQRLRLGLTTTRLTGRHPGGALVTLEIVAPFTASRSLQDEDRLRTTIAPCTYLNLFVKNVTANAMKGVATLGVRLRAGCADAPGAAALSLFAAGGAEIAGAGLNMAGGSAVLDAPFDLPAGAEQEFSFVLGSYLGDDFFADKDSTVRHGFYYRRFWRGLDEVMRYARENAGQNLERSAEMEAWLRNTGCSPEEKWVMALSWRSDQACAWFLAQADGSDPRFYLWEGNYKMLSTIDVAHETEAKAFFAPWRLRLQLEEWGQRQLITLEKIQARKAEVMAFAADESAGISAAEQRELERQRQRARELEAGYGPYISHDAGRDMLLQLGGVYGSMPVEENADFVLLLYWYWHLSRDDEFVRRNMPLVIDLMDSNRARDKNGSGIADTAFGCTTYDCWEAITVAPENTCLGVRQAAAYGLAAEMLKRFGHAQDAERFLEEIKKIAASLAGAFKSYGYVPVSLDRLFDGWNQYCSVLCEGLLYVALTGAVFPGLDSIIAVLKRDFQPAYEACRDSYGIRATSGESPAWFSKTIAADVVARRLLNTPVASAAYAYAWNKNSNIAYNDGAMSLTRRWSGTYYPRGIVSLAYAMP